MESSFGLESHLLRTSRTFALAIPFLPQPIRADVGIAYLVLRVADTLEDASVWTRHERIQALQDFDGLLRGRPGLQADVLIRQWLEVPPTDHDGYLRLLQSLEGLLDAVNGSDSEVRPIIIYHATRTIQRMAFFVEKGSEDGTIALQTFTELRDYCYAVAGIVGELLTDLFVIREPSLKRVEDHLLVNAASFGEGLQLVNILKDVGDDVAARRFLIPPRVERKDVIQVARQDLAHARCYVRALQAANASSGIVAFTALPVMLADRTLDRVAAQGAGAKLSRNEVASILQSMQTHLHQGDVFA